MDRAYYATSLHDFLRHDPNQVIGQIVSNSQFAAELTQRDAWVRQIEILRDALSGNEGRDGQAAIYLEFNIPRLGKRIDTVVVLGGVVFVIEFKVGSDAFDGHAIDQVVDYALDLKNFHETSHSVPMVPVLVATEAKDKGVIRAPVVDRDGLYRCVSCSGEQLKQLFDVVLSGEARPCIDGLAWGRGRYYPTPTIIEAAKALYAGHQVEEITRSDADSVNLAVTSAYIERVVEDAKCGSKKVICFVTGVPGAGKTLVGLNIATKHIDKESVLHSVFLSGNGPLVGILREALARDKVERAKEAAKENGSRVRIGQARSEVSLFVQNVHHFRDDCLRNEGQPPLEHVVIFDEAQRAWDLTQTQKFMKQKRGQANFSQSEPEFLIGCMDRHRDWAVIVCLVGGGQEINTGEAGIAEWVAAIRRSYPDWEMHISPRLTDSEYGSGAVIEGLQGAGRVHWHDALHLGVSIRSFRAEKVSLFVKQVLDRDVKGARETLDEIRERYPIVLTRDIKKAKEWLRAHARGSERFGVVVSSEAQRLKPHAIDVRVQIDPLKWFLADKSDVRSSNYLEDVATEFQIQGLELDWVCITWDGDFRFEGADWEHWSFVGDKWTRIRQEARRLHQKNAYRVLLTRARQGMVIVVPEGDPADPTRSGEFYDGVYEYLRGIGVELID